MSCTLGGNMTRRYCLTLCCFPLLPLALSLPVACLRDFLLQSCSCRTSCAFYLCLAIQSLSSPGNWKFTCPHQEATYPQLEDCLPAALDYLVLIVAVVRFARTRWPAFLVCHMIAILSKFTFESHAVESLQKNSRCLSWVYHFMLGLFHSPGNLRARAAS